MPRGDRTGPRGLGPRTGRAAGYCAGYPVPGFMNPTPGYGRGFNFGRGRRRGRGFGGGFGRGRWYYPQPRAQYPPAYPPPVYPLTTTRQTPEEECATLEDYNKELEAERADLVQEMNEVEARIKELRTKNEQRKNQPKEQ